MHDVAAIGDIENNHLFGSWSSHKKEEEHTDSINNCLFHYLCEESQLSAVIVAMQDAPRTRKLNDDAFSLQREMKWKKNDLAKKKGMENSTDMLIESLIYYGMRESEACWKTLQDVVWG